MKKLISITTCLALFFATQAQTVIGTTTYSVQTNNAPKGRVHVYDGGLISGQWIGSTATDGIYGDRGTFYNHFDGVSWGAWPTSRIEGIKTGFGTFVHSGDNEVSFAHDGFTPSHIRVYGNAAVGGGTWSELPGSNQVIGLWPVAYCEEGTETIYVVSADANPPTALNFSRSEDGGNSWTVLNQTVPYLTAVEGIPGLNTGLLQAAETSQIVAHGNDVYILFCMVNSDMVLLHSNDYGNPGSWDNSVIMDFPLDAYTGLTQTDVNGDFVTDTIETTDGYTNMIITDDGTVHVFAGYARIYNDGVGSYWAYNYTNSQKMWYWQSGMDAAETIDLTLDWDNTDGLNDPIAGIGVYRFHYRYACMVSSPVAAIDESTNHLYVLYTMPIEYTDNYGDPLNASAQSRRDIFGIFSADGGATWSAPVNMTNTAEDGMENFFVFADPKISGGKMHTVWQRDNEPGTAITDGDPIDVNDIVYNGWDIAEDFGDVAAPDVCYPVAPEGLYADDITSSSATMHWDAVPNADQYVVAFWNAADIATVGKKRPNTNEYAIGEGKLEPETTYGFRVRTVCYDEGEKSPYSATAYFTTGPLRAGAYPTSVLVYPNPAHSVFTVQLNGYIGNTADVRVVDALGQTVYAEVMDVQELHLQLTLDIPNMLPGLYTLIVRSGDEQNTTRVVMQ
ncbi:MAG: T9SS type A sorting domain-containing protein [Chitinophagales bacterium]